jgi:hypothetical protein
MTKSLTIKFQCCCAKVQRGPTVARAASFLALCVQFVVEIRKTLCVEFVWRFWTGFRAETVDSRFWTGFRAETVDSAFWGWLPRGRN